MGSSEAVYRWKKLKQWQKEKGPRWSGRVSNSCSIYGTRRVTLVTNPVIGQQRYTWSIIFLARYSHFNKKWREFMVPNLLSLWNHTYIKFIYVIVIVHVLDSVITILNIYIYIYIAKQDVRKIPSISLSKPPKPELTTGTAS